MADNDQNPADQLADEMEKKTPTEAVVDDLGGAGKVAPTPQAKDEDPAPEEHWKS